MMTFSDSFKQKYHEAAQDVANLLKLELDYELTSLSHAMKMNDVKEIERSKKRLEEISLELSILKHW